MMRLHIRKLKERAVDTRLRREVKIGEQQYGFMPGESSTDALIGWRLLIE